MHTWTRTLEWHPHVHMLVPGGALSADGQTWLSPPRRKQAFLVPVKALGSGFRGRFMRLARRALPEQAFPTSVWDKPWVVFSKPVAHGADQVLKYLGRYVQRTAITDRAIVSYDDERVVFTYRDSRDGYRKTMRLPSDEFLRRFLQHVPPKGFHRVRAFGLLSSAHRPLLNRLQLMLGTSAKPEPTEPEEPTNRYPPCPHCGEAALRWVRRLNAAQCVLMTQTQSALRLKPKPLAFARAPPHAAKDKELVS